MSACEAGGSPGRRGLSGGRESGGTEETRWSVQNFLYLNAVTSNTGAERGSRANIVVKNVM